MGKYINKFKKGLKKIDTKMQNLQLPDQDMTKDFPDEDDPTKDDLFDSYLDEEVGIKNSQRPESFHHFILENQYKDLEMSIRGFKDVYDKDSRRWLTKRKAQHCFTDEEAENILRTAQSHLATDIKLGYISKETFPLVMDAIYTQLSFLFESIAEYRYGRYKTTKDTKDKSNEEIDDINYELQYQMKLQNLKIYLELITRVNANYSRAIQGQENKYTHDSVKAQESLNNTDRDLRERSRYT